MKHKLFFIITLFCSVLSAQNTAKIRGTITIEGTPAFGAEIMLISNKKIWTTANENGVFDLENIPVGKQELKISFVSAKSKKVSVNVKPNTNQELKIDLQFDNQLNEIVVSGTLKPISRMESPVPVEVYTPTFFKKNPTSNVFEALENVNGVRPQLNCGVCNTGDIHINGLEGPYTFVLIDGMPIVSGLSTVYGLSGIPNSLIERIEIVKGPASSLYGSEAVAGLINVITKKTNNSPLFSIDTFATTWGEFNLDLSTKFNIGKASSILGVNYFNYNQIIDKNNDGYTDLALQDRISVFNKWNFERKSNKLFTLAGRFYYEDRWGGELNYDTDIHRGGDDVYGESIYTARGEVFGVYEFPTEEDLTLSFSANTHKQNSYYGDTLYDAEQNIGFYQLVWNKELGKNDLLVGAAGRYNYYDDNTEATFTDNVNDPDEVFIPSIFVQNQIDFGEKHDLLLGLRHDYDERHGNIFTPRMAYKFAPTKNDVFRLNAGTGFRVVNLFTEEHAALTGSRDVVITEDLDPEQSINGNLNYLMKRYLSSGTFFNIEASAWYTYFTNKIVPDYETDDDLIIYSNSQGYDISRGISLQADVNFQNGLKVLLGASLQEVFNVTDNVKEQQILTENFNANLSVSYKYKPWNLLMDYTGSLYSPMRLPVFEDLDDPRDEYSPYWGTHNIQFTYDGFKKWEIYGGVKNIFDWTPASSSPFVISRGNDPFEKIDDDSLLPFDTTYVYTSMQGIRGFVGLRYSLF